MAKQSTQDFRFRVSDALPVPLRGTMLRLRLVAGTPVLSALEPGSTIHLEGPGGETRTAEVKALSTTGGHASQRLLEKYGQLDVLIPPPATDGRPVQIGWYVVGG